MFYNNRSAVLNTITSISTTSLCWALRRFARHYATSLATACPSSFTGSLQYIDGGSTFGWTQYTQTYVATNTQPYLSFGMETDNHRYFFLDDVSVVDVTATATQLLDNPGFENSTTTATGWTLQAAGCCNANAVQIITTGCHSGTNCVQYQCGPEVTYSFFGQDFAATIGHTYSISFYLKATGTGGQPTFCAVNVY
ncbi:unnamed protein product [Rotaria socialis]|uniref:Uncharacterized protein n=1 Tax=Rotaria socialis TaxID=392032 RepID=A0A820ZCE4_9BILA|nr:unnamed protein product [Rotaria socialis]